MRQFKEQFVSSARELKQLRTLVVASMMIAIAAVLGFFTIQIGDFIKIGFSFIANEITALLFGPVVGSITAGIADIIKYFIKPTGPFFPGFTISAVVGGLIYGLVLYQKKLSIKRIVVAKVLVAVIVNIFMNTYWLSLLYDKGYMLFLPGRIIKQLVMVPIETVIFYVIVFILAKANVLKQLKVKA